MMTVNAGSGPPVVFISQLGTGGESWQPVIGRMRSGSGTVTYDRPGTGSCLPRPAPNPPLPYSAFADELVSLLDDERISEPAVVVSHSIGCLIARVLADRYPDRIAGMVFIDGSIPRRTLWPAGPLDQPPDGGGPHATHFDSLAGEVEVVEAVSPHRPAAVIMRTPGRWPENYDEGADSLWIAYQRQLAREYRAPLIVAADAGHQVPAEAPALVAHVVDAVVRGARGRTAVALLGARELKAAGGALDRP
jgi:pimeloyl-ACP methyl ester carboxylesterase